MVKWRKLFVAFNLCWPKVRFHNTTNSKANKNDMHLAHIDILHCLVWQQQTITRHNYCVTQSLLGGSNNNNYANVELIVDLARRTAAQVT